MITTVDGCTFNVTAGISGAFNTTPDIGEDDEGVGYIGTGVESKVPAWTLTPGEMKITGTVETYGGNPSIITEFSLGIVQNVIVYQRNAVYDNGYTLSEQFQYGQPLRDGEPLETPFSYDATAITDQGVFSTKAKDAPRWSIPKHLNGGKLVSTSGSNTLASWLILARQPANPQLRRVVLLGRLLWVVDFNAAMDDNGKLKFTDNPQTVFQTLDMDTEMTVSGSYPVGTGSTWPDLREDISGNTYVFGAWAGGSGPTGSGEWSYDDEGDAVAFVQQPNPAFAASWLTGSPSP